MLQLVARVIGSVFLPTGWMPSNQYSHLPRCKTFSEAPRRLAVAGSTPAFEKLGDGVWSISDDTTRRGTNLGLVANSRPDSLDSPSLELSFVFVGSPGAFEAPELWRHR